MADLSQHTRELRTLRMLDRLADPTEPERPQRSAVAGSLADRATNLGDLQRRHQFLRPAKPPEAVDRRLQHVDRVRRSEAFRQDVANACELEDRADAAAGDDPRSLAGWTEQHARRVRAPDDLVRDRC